MGGLACLFKTRKCGASRSLPYPSLLAFGQCAGPALLPGDHPRKSQGKDIVAPRGGVQVIPEQISIRVNGRNVLGASSHVRQGVAGGRGDDFVEERKDIQLDKMEMPAKVEVVQDVDPCAQNLIEENT